MITSTDIPSSRQPSPLPDGRDSGVGLLPPLLFIDRDGTILQEPADEQIDSFAKFHFVPGAISALRFLRQHTDYRFIMVSNQDGLGTSSYPEEDFWPTHNLMLEILAGEGVTFDDILIDRSFPEDNLPTRKPGTAMLAAYTDGSCNLAASYVIGDRPTDAQLAANLGCQALILSDELDWQKIVERIYAGSRKATVRRTTRETDIAVTLDLDLYRAAEVSGYSVEDPSIGIVVICSESDRLANNVLAILVRAVERQGSSEVGIDATAGEREYHRCQDSYYEQDG